MTIGRRTALAAALLAPALVTIPQIGFADTLFVVASPLRGTTPPSTVVAYDIDADGVPVPAASYTTSGLAEAMSSVQEPALDPARSLLFIPNNISNDITVFEVAPDASLTEVPGSPFATGSGPSWSALHPSLPYLYLTTSSDSTVRTLEIVPDGSLMEVDAVSLGTNPRDLEVEPGGRFLYLADMTHGARAFEIGPAGLLSELPGSPFGQASGRPKGVRVSSDGSRVFVLYLDAGLAVFDVDASGALGEVPGSPFAVNGFASPLELHEDRMAYVGHPFATEIEAFEITPSGTPSPVTGSPFPAEQSATALLAPSGTARLYEVSREASSISPFAIAADGSLSSIVGPVPVNVPGAVPNGADYLGRGVLQVGIDVKPGSDRNPLNLGSRGVIPVAVLGSADFDVASIDHASVRFAPAPAGPAHIGPHGFEDVNRDGHLDFIAHFRTQEAGIACGDTSATLTGSLYDGTEFTGSDVIDTIACP